MIGNFRDEAFNLNPANSRECFGNVAHPRIQLAELGVMIDLEVTFQRGDQTDDLLFPNLHASTNSPNRTRR